MLGKTHNVGGKLDNRTNALPKTKKTAASKRLGFPIVGIGASAGGLEAIEQFFTSMPSDSGLAFIIVQHLDPNAHSSMPEILSRFTKMPINVVSDRLKVKPNSIYLNPPGKSMEIESDTLYLREPAQPHGFRLPVDFFLRSLAGAKGADSVAVILSGTGSDGTLGVKAIKESLGTVFVQEPESARYDGMPRSAIDTGLVDFVLKPDDIPNALIEFLKHSVINVDTFTAETEKTAKPLQQIFAILRTRTGHDFSHYKAQTIRRRLQRRMSVNQINDVSKYSEFLKGNEDEIKALLKDLLISVTSFFRDPEAFKALKTQLKKLVNSKVEGGDLRVWVTGCATGEEAYSVAMVISECLSELEKQLHIQIYGTDIDIDALRVARAGRYSDSIDADVTPERLKRFFTRKNDTCRINQEIREMVVFAPQNFIKDPPFLKMDLICCRNLLIYLDSDAQKQLLPLLHYALKPEGLLFLGTSETVGEAGDLFTILEKKWKIYQRREIAVNTDRLKFPPAFAPSFHEPIRELARGVTETRISELAEKVFLDSYAPTFAVIDEKYRLVYVRGRTGKYLEIASGQPSLSILEMAREGLRTEMASAIYQASSEKKKIVHEGIHIKHNGGFQMVNLTVAPLTVPGIPPGFLIIVFQEMGLEEKASVKPSKRGSKRVAELEEELRLVKESQQATVEELEATNEELKSANEELQSNNEELQSTNEELDTSREELQSLNEELSTLNSELQDKNELLNKASDDLNNFLNRTDIAIVLLDNELNIRSYTPATSEIFNVRKIDIGRPFAEITSRLINKEVWEDADKVLRTMEPIAIEMQRNDGHWYNMRISPYRTAQNVFSGLVISVLDINEQKKAADSLRETRDYLDNLFNNASGPIMVWTNDLKITRFNHASERLTGRSVDEMLGKKIDILIPSDKRSEAIREINRVTTIREIREAVEIPVQHVDGTVRIVLWNLATLFDTNSSTPIATIAQGQDITERKQLEDTLTFLLQSGTQGSDKNFFDSLARFLSQTLDVGYVCIDQLEGDKLTAKTLAIYNNGVFESNVSYELKDTPCGAVVGKAICCFPRDVRKLFPKDAALQDLKAESYAGTALLDFEGKPIGLIAIIGQKPLKNQSLTESVLKLTSVRAGRELERKKANEYLEKQYENEKGLRQELESYSYSISHDLRAPLRVLDGFSEVVLLDYGDKLDEQGKDYLNRIRTASQTMAQMIDDILKLSRVTRSDIHHDGVKLSDLVQKIADETRATQPKRQAEFVIQPDIMAYGDVGLLEIALKNLIDNSWKFTGKTQQTRIEFGSTLQDGKQVYFVKDNGVGFDMQYADKLFQPFRRLHSETEFPGTGIGLATVQRIIHRHGGNIWVESVQGKGTTFYFTLGQAE